MNPTLFVGALVTGLLGAGHCIGMCGGIVSALSLGGSRHRGFGFHVLYNLGRLVTYVLIGFAVGALGQAFERGHLAAAGRYLLVGGDLFVVAVGLGTFAMVGRLNVMRLELRLPIGWMVRSVRGLERLPTGLVALPTGMLMGLLPCGFLYAVAVNAALSGSAVAGAWVMFGFALGTAPSLLFVGGLSHLVGTRARERFVRLAGLLVAAMGAVNLWRHLHMLGLV